MEEDAFFRKFILNIFLKEGEKLYICTMRIIYDTNNYGVITGKFNASTNYKEYVT